MRGVTGPIPWAGQGETFIGLNGANLTFIGLNGANLREEPRGSFYGRGKRKPSSGLTGPILERSHEADSRSGQEETFIGLNGANLREEPRG